jgi:hypothetical protein
VVADEAEGGEGNQLSGQGKYMKTKAWNVREWRILWGFLAIALVAASILSRAKETGQTSPASPQTGAQRAFASPNDAAQALIKAAGSFDLPALKDILGPDGKDLVSSEDSVQDKNRATAFAEKASEKNSVTVDPKNPMRATLSVGNDDWPLPIPIVQREGRWYFDTKAGHREILLRRIGANELDAIQICRGYVEAQEEYALKKHDGALVNQYAQRIISTPGKQDGLAWRNADGNWEGPIGEGVAKALDQGYTNRSQPYHGYFFKILKGQGPAARLGQINFVVEGAMIGGFALAAAPAEYRVTGVKTFIVSYDGIVYEKDLGPNSLSIFKDMSLYNPDKTWKRTDDNW